jgi:hypothetical protein
MKQSAIVSLAVLGALSPVLAAPTEQTVFGVDRQDDPHPIPDKPNFKFDPLQRMFSRRSLQYNGDHELV